jgi:DNA-directed RNA polymerase specialized sigma24 family protein
MVVPVGTVKSYLSRARARLRRRAQALGIEGLA